MRNTTLLVLDEHLFIGTEIVLEVEYYHSYCPGTRTTPPCKAFEIEKINHKGRTIDPDTIVRYLQYIDGRKYNYEDFTCMVYDHLIKYNQLEHLLDRHEYLNTER